MGTATILGDTYQTVAMPDGKEWIAENLAWSGAGQANTNPAFGRLYTWAEAMALSTGDGWRLPTLPELRSMYSACDYTTGDFAVYAGAGALKTTTAGFWFPPNDGAADAFGFYALAGGYWFFGYAGQGYYGGFWTSTEVDAVSAYTSSHLYNSVDAGIAANTKAHSWSVRLVRDYTPPADINAEAHETTHALALEWTEAADGTPVAYDDGAAYDYIESTITARMTPDELAALETAWQSSTKLYTIYSTGYLLGPLIDMSAGVEVRLMSYQEDQSADSAMTLYDVTIGVHYGPLSAPSAGSLAVVQSRGRPYHSVAPGAASWITEGGTSDVNAYGRASERSCTWYTHSLTTAQAADVVNALRTIRGSSTTWTAGGVATPWGPGESGTATVWIPEWSIHRESNLLWGVQMELVRNG